MDFPFDKDILLENARVLLRPLQYTDYEFLHPIALGTPSLVQYSPYEINSEALLKTYIEQAIQDRADKVRYAFIIFDKATNKYAGSTSFGFISD